MTVDQIIGALVARRHELNLSQRSVGDRVGAAQSGFSQWENGLAEPSLRRLLRWAAVLGVEIVAVPMPGFTVEEES